MRPYSIVSDAAKKMGVSEREVFIIASCVSKWDIPEEQEELEWHRYLRHDQITERMFNFCLDVLTGKIPLLKTLVAS